jgi:hypothetical protein
LHFSNNKTGVAQHLNYITEGGLILGKQTNGPNCSYFWQNTGIHKVMNFSEGKKQTSYLFDASAEEFQVQTMHEGSIIDIKVDFDTSRVHFWHNDKYQGYTECINNPLKEGAIFPAASFR